MKFLTPLVIVVLFVALAIFGYSIYKQDVPNRPSQGPNPTPQLIDYTKAQSQSSCAQLAPIAGEISCLEAMNIALEKYPGEVIGAVQFDGYKTEDGPRNAWRIAINLKSPLPIREEKGYFDSIVIGIDRGNGKLLFSNRIAQ